MNSSLGLSTEDEQPHDDLDPSQQTTTTQLESSVIIISDNDENNNNNNKEEEEEEESEFEDIDEDASLEVLCITVNQTGTRVGIGHSKGFRLYSLCRPKLNVIVSDGGGVQHTAPNMKLPQYQLVEVLRVEEKMMMVNDDSDKEYNNNINNNNNKSESTSNHCKLGDLRRRLLLEVMRSEDSEYSDMSQSHRWEDKDYDGCQGTCLDTDYDDNNNNKRNNRPPQFPFLGIGKMALLYETMTIAVVGGGPTPIGGYTSCGSEIDYIPSDNNKIFVFQWSMLRGVVSLHPSHSNSHYPNNNNNNSNPSTGNIQHIVLSNNLIFAIDGENQFHVVSFSGTHYYRSSIAACLGNTSGISRNGSRALGVDGNPLTDKGGQKNNNNNNISLQNNNNQYSSSASTFFSMTSEVFRTVSNGSDISGVGGSSARASYSTTPHPLPKSQFTPLISIDDESMRVVFPGTMVGSFVVAAFSSYTTASSFGGKKKEIGERNIKSGEKENDINTRSSYCNTAPTSVDSERCRDGVGLRILITIQAHNHGLACLAVGEGLVPRNSYNDKKDVYSTVFKRGNVVSSDKEEIVKIMIVSGQLVVSCSVYGTLVRVWDVERSIEENKGVMLMELRTSNTPCVVRHLGFRTFNLNYAPDGQLINSATSISSSLITTGRKFKRSYLYALVSGSELSVYDITPHKPQETHHAVCGDFIDNHSGEGGDVGHIDEFIHKNGTSYKVILSKNDNILSYNYDNSSSFLFPNYLSSSWPMVVKSLPGPGLFLPTWRGAVVVNEESPTNNITTNNTYGGFFNQGWKSIISSIGADIAQSVATTAKNVSISSQYGLGAAYWGNTGTGAYIGNNNNQQQSSNPIYNNNNTVENTATNAIVVNGRRWTGPCGQQLEEVISLWWEAPCSSSHNGVLLLADSVEWTNSNYAAFKHYQETIRRRLLRVGETNMFISQPPVWYGNHEGKIKNESGPTLPSSDIGNTNTTTTTSASLSFALPTICVVNGSGELLRIALDPFRYIPQTNAGSGTWRPENKELLSFYPVVPFIISKKNTSEKRQEKR